MTTDVDPLLHVETWIFDLDNTLYPAACNLFAQVDLRMTAFIGTRFGLPHDEARTLQKRFFRTHGTTLRGLMVERGVSPGDFLDYVHDIDLSCVPPNATLGASLDALAGRKVVFTNGSAKHADRVLGRLGVADRFEAVWDIVESDYIPKPDPRIYDRLIADLAIDPARTAMVEDIAVNLVPAHERGMTTVWVDTGFAWSAPDPDAEHVHHRIDDVATWLADLVAARRAASPPN